MLPTLQIGSLNLCAKRDISSNRAWWPDINTNSTRIVCTRNWWVVHWNFMDHPQISKFLAKRIFSFNIGRVVVAMFSKIETFTVYKDKHTLLCVVLF